MQVHRPHTSKSLCSQTCQLPQTAPGTEINCQLPLFLAVKVSPVIGTGIRAAPEALTEGKVGSTLLHPWCHRPLGYLAEPHCFVQWEMLWEPSLDHSFSMAVLIPPHQHIKDLVDDKVAGWCGVRTVLFHQGGCSWSHFHFGWAISYSLLGFARVSVDAGAQSVQSFKWCIHMPVLRKSGRWIGPSF